MPGPLGHLGRRLIPGRLGEGWQSGRGSAGRARRLPRPEMGRGRAQSGGKHAVTVPLRLLAGSRESLLSCTLTASEEAMAVLEEVILYAFQQCVYYVSKVRQGQGVCLTLPWAGRAGDLGRTEVLLPPSPEGFELQLPPWHT